MVSRAFGESLVPLPRPGCPTFIAVPSTASTAVVMSRACLVSQSEACDFVVTGVIATSFAWGSVFRSVLKYVVACGLSSMLPSAVPPKVITMLGLDLAIMGIVPVKVVQGVKSQDRGLVTKPRPGDERLVTFSQPSSLATGPTHVLLRSPTVCESPMTTTTGGSCVGVVLVGDCVVLVGV